MNSRGQRPRKRARHAVPRTRQPKGSTRIYAAVSLLKLNPAEGPYIVAQKLAAGEALAGEGNQIVFNALEKATGEHFGQDINKVRSWLKARGR